MTAVMHFVGFRDDRFTNAVKAFGRPASAGAVCVRTEGVRFEITNNAVITVTPDRTNPGNTTKRRNQRIIERRDQA